MNEEAIKHYTVIFCMVITMIPLFYGILKITGIWDKDKDKENKGGK